MWSTISTLIIGVAGTFISYQQWRVAEIRIRHDTMPERKRVHDAAKTLLVTFQNEGKITEEDYFTYLRGIADAKFIFDDDPEATQYLQTLRDRATELIRLQKQGSAEAHAEISQWFITQFDVLRSKFHSSMRLHPPPTGEKIRQCAERLLSSLRRGSSRFPVVRHLLGFPSLFRAQKLFD
jgi:hypothetical protein